MDIDELQQLIDQELKALPGPRAPETLLPRVLGVTVRRKPAPWYARPWLAWPLRWQAASVIVLLALGAGLSMLLLQPSPWTSEGPSPSVASSSPSVGRPVSPPSVTPAVPPSSVRPTSPSSPVGPPVSSPSSVGPTIFRPVARIAEILSQAAAVTRACWKAVIEPFAFWLLVVALSLSLACGALWSALEREALGGASRQ